MKSFLLSFLFAGLGCAAVWHHWRSETAVLQNSAPVPRPPNARVTVAPLPAPGAAARALAHAQQSWSVFTQRKDQDTPITADHWAALDAVSDADIPGWAAQMKPDHYDRRWKAVMMRWASLDGRAAMAHARSYPYGYAHILGDLLACWMRRDPAGCAAEIKNLRISGDWIAAVTTLAQTDLSRALDVLAATLGEQRKENSEWSEDAHPGYLGAQLRDPARKAEFIRWIKRHPDSVAASRVFSIVFNSMDHEDAWLRPERMPDYMPARDQLPQSLEHPDTVWTMGALAAGENPLTSLRDKTAAPFQERTDAPDHHSLFTRLYKWAVRDPESAGLWLKAQPPSPELDQAARGYLLAVQDEHPAAAVLWAGTINDPGERVRETADHYARWHRQQPAEAEAWLTAAGFPELHRLYIARRTGGR